MKFAIVTPIWRRPELTKAFLNYYAEMETEHEILRFVVYSRDDPDFGNCDTGHEGWAPERTILTTYPNKPRGDKLNRAFDMAEGHADAVVLIPSDDFFLPSYFDYLAEKMEDYEAVRMNSFYFLDATSGKMIYSDAVNIGAGYCFRRDLLDRMDWKVIRGDQDSRIDTFMFQRVRQYLSAPSAEYIEKNIKDQDVGGVDVKTADNVNSFEYLEKHLRSYEYTYQPESMEPIFFALMRQGIL